MTAKPEETSGKSSQRLRRNDEMLSAELDGDLVFLSAANGRYLHLSGTGRLMWEMLEEPQTVDALMAKLAQRYPADRERIEADVPPFVQHMVAEGLLLAD